MTQLPDDLQQRLAAAEMVEWDRFIMEENGDNSPMIRVYGWVDRDDQYKDFVLVDYFVEPEEVTYITSNPSIEDDLEAALVHKDEDVETVDCKRVEHYSDIDNAIQLGD